MEDAASILAAVGGPGGELVAIAASIASDAAWNAAEQRDPIAASSGYWGIKALGLVAGVRGLSAPKGGTLTFYRGMTYGEALEAVQGQALSAERIAANQALNSGAAGSGAYMTTQEATAAFYGDLAGLQGRGLGPAVVRMEVPAEQFSSFAAARGFPVETPIPRGPSPTATETLIPMEYIQEFNAMTTFFLHK